MTRSRKMAVVVCWMSAQAALAEPPLSGSAAWYGEELKGKLMANGRPFEPDQLTAACWLYPLGTKLRVTATGSTNSVEVVVTDRGPSRQLLSKGRILDLSRGAFERLAPRERGVIAVRVQK